MEGWKGKMKKKLKESWKNEGMKGLLKSPDEWMHYLVISCILSISTLSSLNQVRISFPVTIIQNSLDIS